MKSKSIVTFIIVTLFLPLFSTSCKTKEGCGLEEKYGPRTDKDGRLSTKKGDSTLFSPKMEKNKKKKKS